MKTGFLQWLKKGVGFVGQLMPDFIMLVLGIMVSLWLDDRRELANARDEEREILAQVMKDLKADTAKVNKNLTIVTEAIARNTKLSEISRDSIDANFTKVYFDTRRVMSYEPLDPSTAGYIELSAQIARVGDKRLLMKIMRMYEIDYRNIELLNTQHSEYLINTVYKYMSTQIPYMETDNDKTTEKVKAFEKALLSDEFKHLLYFDIRLRENLKSFYKVTFEEQSKLIDEIENELAKR